MKIALVTPFISDGNLTPPLGILYIAAVLEQDGHEVLFFDQRVDSLIADKITDFAPEILGITAVTPSFNNGIRIAQTVKQRLPKLRVVFGGPHTEALPETSLSEEGIIDYIIVGEGEYPMRDLCRKIGEKKISPVDLSSVNNLYFRADGKIVATPRAEFLTNEELDNLPYPAYHLLNLEKYFDTDQSYGLFVKSTRNLPVMTSRGCPSGCTYCCRVMGYKFRKRSWQNVIDEMEYIIHRFRVDEIQIVDDNFTIDKQRAKKILDEIIARRWGVYLKFANGLRADRLDLELLNKMKEAGCYTVAFGIESGSERVLSLMNKKQSLEKVKEAVAMAKSLELLVGGNCIVGYPEETMDDINESIDYFWNLKLDSMAIVNLVPFPGTEVRRICEEKGYLTKEAENWDNYLFVINNPIPLVETEFLTAEDLIKVIKKTYTKIYLRPRNVVTILKNLSFKHILRGLKLFFRL